MGRRDWESKMKGNKITIKEPKCNCMTVSAKGQATVEFALVLLVLLAVVYGIIEISRLMLANAEISNAAREGAHYAALHPRVNAYTCLRNKIILPRLTMADKDSANLSVTRLPLDGAPDSAFTFPHTIAVTVNYQWTSLVNIMPDMGSMTLKPFGPLMLHATSAEPIENSDASLVTSQCP